MDLKFDLTIKCKCGRYGVLISPFTGKTGELCHHCILERFEDALAYAEAHELLTMGKDERR